MNAVPAFSGVSVAMDEIGRVLDEMRRRLEDLEKRIQWGSDKRHELGDRTQALYNEIKRDVQNVGHETDRIAERQTGNSTRIDRIERFLLGVLVFIALAALGSLLAMIGWVKP